MKKAVLSLSAALMLILFASCGSNKDLQKDIPASFGEIYYTSGPEEMELFIPVSYIQENRVNFEAVYFYGMRSPLAKSETQPNLYVAKFDLGSDDLVMHRDSEKEYGNRPPQLPKQSPFEINKDEAILVFSKNGKMKYYKLTGITEKE